MRQKNIREQGHSFWDGGREYKFVDDKITHNMPHTLREVIHKVVAFSNNRKPARRVRLFNPATSTKHTTAQMNDTASFLKPMSILPTQIHFIGFVCRQKTMHRLLCFKSKFPNHFAFTLGHFNCYSCSSLFYVDVNCNYIYLVKVELLPKMY